MADLEVFLGRWGVAPDSKIDQSNVHEIVLVGGSTRIPPIPSLSTDFFNGKSLTRHTLHDMLDGGALDGFGPGGVVEVFLFIHPSWTTFTELI